MTTPQLSAILGAGAGSAGPIITAFSLNRTLRELSVARKGIEHTVDALTTNQRDVPVFTGFDKRYVRATRWGNRLVWLGVILLVARFILQATSVVMGP